MQSFLVHLRTVNKSIKRIIPAHNSVCKLQLEQAYTFHPIRDTRPNCMIPIVTPKAAKESSVNIGGWNNF